MKLHTFIYDQNNPGGVFINTDSLGKMVFIEAYNTDEANAKAESIGIYFDGVSEGKDCKCCGNRWERADFVDTLEELNFDPFKFFMEYHPNMELGFLYKYSGEKIKIDIVDSKLVLKKV